MDLNLIISLASILIGLISIFLGILMVRRFSGKLRTFVILLTFAVIIFIIKESIKIHSFVISTSYNIEPIGSILNSLIILVILIAIINMRQMINGIDGHYNHKKKK